MPAKHVLFAMCDTLRWDGLSRCGLKRLHVCGTSRMSTDTGRYMKMNRGTDMRT